jgi:hypothetical protein
MISSSPRALTQDRIDNAAQPPHVKAGFLSRPPRGLRLDPGIRAVDHYLRDVTSEHSLDDIERRPP